ncbi:TraR/DksA family transcriptional regulator [Longimicrobium sp.]|uniref:TraR/DksA family transcriptional regulator n=1 Tax=Longimicrobium sp. TaxID=2029185 RepID=UPI002CFAB10A|nr:TraR/DksA C4-type zinc finger protein [Longimicrobium sp.]HSU17287.1 TraR/DksA C4-type zinc finger protein [Longimicrobium sp.]
MTAVQTPLRADQIAMVRSELLRSLNKLERSLKISGESARPRDLEQDTVGRLSRIDAIQNAGLTANLEERERQQLGQVVDALRRIEDGTYGACNGCGAVIPFERLMVFPETLACAACTRGS